MAMTPGINSIGTGKEIENLTAHENCDCEECELNRLIFKAEESLAEKFKDFDFEKERQWLENERAEDAEDEAFIRQAMYNNAFGKKDY